MKNLCYVIALAAIAISLLTACDKEEEETYVPGLYSWDFGYIKGALNGTDISLQNEGGQWGKHIPAKQRLKLSRYEKTNSLHFIYSNAATSCHAMLPDRMQQGR